MGVGEWRIAAAARMLARRSMRHAVTLGVTLLFLSASGALAQQSREWDPERLQVTREALQDLLQRLDQAANSQAYSKAFRERSKTEAALVRARLEEGDFQVGDRIRLMVEEEAQLTDTFTVAEGRVLALPGIGTISLRGVLRSELESHLRHEIGRYVRNPVVRSRSLIRVSLLGELGRPGFYQVPTDMVFADALMLAGGPSATAKLASIRIERGDTRIWDDGPLQQAVAEGRTLDQLNLRAGDRIVVPKRGSGITESGIRTITLLLTIPAAIYGLTRLF